MQLTPFQFEANTVRTCTAEDGALFFMGRDVCAAMGYANDKDAMRHHVPEDCVKFFQVTDRLGRSQQSAKFISKRGLLLLLSKSRMSGTRFLDLILAQVADLESILQALRDFEVPDDLPDLFVYAIRETETGRVKLGISRDPEARLAQLQVGNSQRLELVATRRATNRFADERSLHREYSHACVRSEWFSAEAQGAIQ